VGAGGGAAAAFGVVPESNGFQSPLSNFGGAEFDGGKTVVFS
jgi:hypothetical protein